MTKRNLVWDIESNHYDLDIIHTVHCIGIQDLDTEELFLFDETGKNAGTLQEGVNMLQDARSLIGHNIVRFDLPAIQKFYPSFTWDNIIVVDTLIMSKMARPKWFTHSLGKWGETLRFKKGDYAETFKEEAGDSYEKGDEWLTYSKAMGDYCLQDLRVNRRCYLECAKSIPKMFSWENLQLEQYTTALMEKQKKEGVAFDKEAADKLYIQLVDRRDVLEREISKSFTGWYKQGKTFTPKVNNKRFGYVKGSAVSKIIWTPFKPTSHDHIAYWLTKKFGWEPTEFTPTGKPKVSTDIMNAMADKFPICGPLAEHFKTQKILSSLAEAKGSWFNTLTKEGRIHGSVNAQGCNTFRASHSGPNLAQVPKVLQNKEGGILTGFAGGYGSECRSLFSHGRGSDWSFMGCDMSGIEFRLLAHYLARFDGGELADTVLNGDIHSVNQKAAGLPTRDNAKTFIYAFIYGGGDAKLGDIVGKDRAEGARLRAKFLKGMPALATLLARLKRYRKENKGYIRCLDGRHLPVDHVHTILNYLLQSAGAILSKAWMREYHRLAEEAGFVWGKDYVQLLWVHDEVQNAVRTDRAEELGQLCVKAIENVGQAYKLNIPITGEYKVGATWKETH